MADYFDSLLKEIKPTITSRDKYRDGDISIYFKEVHDTTFPPKLEFFLNKLYALTRSRISFKAIFKSPRGGGKSKMASAYEFSAWYMQDAEAVNCGGSEEQARIVFDYCKAYTDKDPDARSVAPERLMLSDRMTKAGPKPQASLQSVPASPKSVRGKHPGGETKTPGICVMDEMVEMEDAIVVDALGMLRGAKPPILICLSTFHKMFGKFQEFWDDTENDFIKFDWDTFDVCEKCTYDCATCVKEIEEKYCKVICNCYMDFEADQEKLPKWKAFHFIKDERTGELKKVDGDIGEICPQCGGRVDHKARFAERGWISIKEIRDSWKLYDLEKFEVDIMGWRPSGSGLVLDPNCLNECIVSGLHHDRRAYLRIGIDWGARGMSALVLIQRFGNGRCEIIDAWHKESPRDFDIYDQLKFWKSKYGVDKVYADQSHPFQNDHIRNELQMDVVEVNFNTQKMAGIGVLKNYTEKRMLYVDSKFTLLVKQLKNWHKDKNGNIRKINDHYCDATLCAMISEAEASELISAFDGQGGYIIDKETTLVEENYHSGYGFDMAYGADEEEFEHGEEFIDNDPYDVDRYGY
jgi:hypothetical protein